MALTSAVYGASSASDPVAVTLTVDDYISLSNPGDVALANIAGTGGSAENSATWTVATNNDAGYKLEVSASGTPAMTKGGDSFADLVDGGTPIPWSVASADSAFGFSAEGTATSSSLWGTPSTGSGKYRGFSGGTAIEVANDSNETSGEDTTIYFKAEVGASHLQASGSYAANLTVTATTL
ncbi:hypothetical protein BMS3Abin01_00842 [bacterium BMS3Abin01]|nr:hypothetical protein BMS3Abin01_00842 [bacterium BMS3Abin01]HDZ59287.1 hypothetical protein [Actinomycetota bacterium]